MPLCTACPTHRWCPGIGHLSYYERWIVAFANILAQTGILSPSELALRMRRIESEAAKDDTVSGFYRGDPSVLFAAERTLLAWQRSAIALMGFGFVIERFGLVLQATAQSPQGIQTHGMSLLLGVVFIAIGVLTVIASMRQYLTLVRLLEPIATPPGYWVFTPLWVGTALIVTAAALIVYLLMAL